MAIKGKTRRRSGGRGAAAAPRPRATSRPKPLLQRRGFRRALIAIFVLASVAGALKLWSNVARADALRRYDRALARAQRPLLEALKPGTARNFLDVPVRFGRGEVATATFRALAESWQTDFTKARDDVRALAAARSRAQPPEALDDTNELVAQGIDGYRGAARLYVVAAIQRALADGQSEKALKQKLEDQVQVLLQHADEARQRAKALHDAAMSRLQALEREWGVRGVPSPAGVPGLPGGLPGRPGPGPGAPPGGPGGFPPGGAP